MISIIIPVHNGEKFIGRCLRSIFDSKTDASFEVIVVDDGSTDSTGKVVQQFPCRYFRMEKSGVAAARNFGIRKTKGEIIFFFDADVKLKEDTIERFLKHFEEDKDAYIIQGRWDKNSPAATFSSRFLLLKYTYNFKGLFNGKRRMEAANLETGCLAVRTEVFNHFKGFDEGYKVSGGEEHELGMRLLEKYKMYYYADIFIEHTFGSIFNTLKKIYRRTINFSMLAFKAKNRDFMKMHKNSVPTQDKASVVIIILLFGSCFLFFFNINFALAVCTVILFAYFLNISRFLLYLASKQSVFFAVIGSFVDFTIMIPRLFGLLRAGYIFYVLRRKEFKV